MKFYQLEFLFALTWQYETDAADLRLIGRLEALGFSPRPGRLQLLEKDWREEEGRSVPDWHETVIDVPSQDLETLVEADSRCLARRTLAAHQVQAHCEYRLAQHPMHDLLGWHRAASIPHG